jgi:hypothetical protein
MRISLSYSRCNAEVSIDAGQRWQLQVDIAARRKT